MFTEYSLYWIIPIVLLSAAVTYFAYFFKRKDEYKTWQRNTLACLRFVSLLMILFLLLSPVVKITKNVIEKPIVVIAQDDSASLVSVSDSTYHRSDYVQSLNRLVENLSKDYQVKLLKFGTKIEEFETKNQKNKTAFEQTETWFQQSETDIASPIDYVSQEFVGENLSALVIASDGISNRGNNPLNACDNVNIPIYTIALGDTNKRKDLLISNVRYNKVAYLDDELPLEITFKAEKADGVNAKVRLYQDGKLLFEKQEVVKGERFSLTLATTALCSKSGIIAFKAEVSGLENENNKHNNVKEFFVEVLDSRQNIVMLSAVPHPDISAIKQGVELNKNYTFESYLFSERTKLKNQQIDLLIAHQLPYDLESYEYLSKLRGNGTPILYVLGGKTDYALFNKSNTGLVVNLYNNKSQTNSQASFNRNFALFSLNEETATLMEDLQPLNAPLARFVSSSAVQTLAYQYINGLKTDYPLLCFMNDAQHKCGVICGENVWRWRLQNYLMNKTSEQVDDIIQKTVRYLVSSADKSLFRIKHDNIFNQGGEITFEAELYNEAYQLINTPEVRIVVQDKQAKEYKYVFSKNANAYYLNMGTLPQGSYTYTATTALSGKTYTAKGAFVVAETVLELVELVANHSMLKTISQKTGGEMVYPKQMDSIAGLIKRNEDIKAVIHTEVSNNRLIESVWYWIVIVLCLSGEWFLRKYWGRI